MVPATIVKRAATYKLWYNEPAEHFEESLVLGNGKVGASVFGGVESDKIYLNEHYQQAAYLFAGTLPGSITSIFLQKVMMNHSR